MTTTTSKRLPSARVAWARQGRRRALGEVGQRLTKGCKGTAIENCRGLGGRVGRGRWR